MGVFRRAPGFQIPPNEFAPVIEACPKSIENPTQPQIQNLKCFSGYVPG